MNCKKCNAELRDDAVFCPECMDRFTVSEKKAQLEEASKASKNTVLQQLHHTTFLVVTICFTAMFLSLVITMLTGGIGGILTNILPFIFMLIAVIGHWSGYTAKDGADIDKILRRVSLYDAYTRVMYTISIVLVSIVGGIITILTFLGGSIISGAGSSLGGNSDEEIANDAVAGGLVAALVIVIILAIVITVISLLRSIYKNRRKYFIDLGASVVSGHYDIAKAPVIGSYILGGYSILAAIPSFMFAGLMDSLLGDLLYELGDLGEMLGGMLDGMAVSMIISGIGNLVIGAYFIVSAIWMKATHETQLKNGAAVSAAKAAYDKAVSDTEDAIRDFELLKKKKEDEIKAAEKAAAEKEAKQAQDAMREQQQMMQMMMMQMMQQQQHGTAPAAPTTPVAPAEEPKDAE